MDKPQTCANAFTMKTWLFEVSHPHADLEFLGQWVTTREVAFVRAKLHAIYEWENPTNIKDIQSFLGFANYYVGLFPAMRTL